MPSNFVHLQVHTEYSILDGACRIPELARRAAELEMSALALTDHGNLFGAIDFYKECRAVGIKPLIGCEMYLAIGSRLERKTGGGEKASTRLILLAKNEMGYRNLIKLVSAAHLEGLYYKPRIDKEVLAQHAEGLIGISECLNGEIARNILANHHKQVRASIKEFQAMFGPGDFYAGITNTGLAQERRMVRELPRYARRCGFKLVATNNVHYVRREDTYVREALLCIKTRAKLQDQERRPTEKPELYLKSAEEMTQLFDDMPEALATTLEIADKCDVEIEFGRGNFPVYSAPEGETREGFLRRLCDQGLERRFGPRAQELRLRQRLDYELGVVYESGFTSYFLIFWDLVDYAKTHGIPVGPGRGNAAGSLIAYVLGITDLDPTKYGLFAESFLNPEQISAPDIDLDLCFNKRDEVVEYLRRKYGERAVAKVVTFGTLGAKMAIRDAGRVIGISYDEADRLAKMVPFTPRTTLVEALTQVSDFRRAYDEEPISKIVIDLALALEGRIRQHGVHAAGFVMASGDMTDKIPLTVDDCREIVTQYSTQSLGELGLLRLNLLSLKALTVIANILRLIEETTGNKIAVPEIPLDDSAAFNLLSQMQTIGVFQMESPGMAEACRHVGPSIIEDVIALVALYRPGLMELIPRYADRKSGKERVEYDHPLLEPILKDTYGILIYQEQVLEVAQSLAGYTLGGADVLRRAMKMQAPDELAVQKTLFIEGSQKKKGIPRREAGHIFAALEKSAKNAFSKAHATCYGVLAYHMAWLKSRYPVQFMAAHLSGTLADLDKIAVLVEDARRMGISIVQSSRKQNSGVVTVKDNSIRFEIPGVFCVQVYRLDGDWYMDDPERGIVLEELILGMPEIIGHLVGRKTDRFICTISAQPLDRKSAVLEKDGESDGGCWYLLRGTSLRGWLCPTIFQYFDPAPGEIYLRWN